MVKLENMVDEVVTDNPVSMNDDKNPRPEDPEWVDYVLDQLSDRELPDGNPTTDGLRRVTEKVFGTILKSDTQILEVPNRAYSGKVTAKHTLIIHRRDINTPITISACVDVVGEKLPAPFNTHLVATACTKAEGKALRRALKIRVQTAEELRSEDDLEMDASGPINDQQITALKALCKRNDVNVAKFIKANSEKPKSIYDVKNIEGRLMINKLSGYQREGTPEEFLGYDENWEESFGGKDARKT